MGGHDNIAYGTGGTIVGGDENYTDALFGTVAGGRSCGAYSGGGYASVFGGFFNHGVGDFVTVVGGNTNRAMGTWSAMCGGYNSRVGSYAQLSTIIGGRVNYAGLLANLKNVQAPKATVCGGAENKANAELATVSGGKANLTFGPLSTITGGKSTNIVSTGKYDWRATVYWCDQ